jgi:predicted Zn-dependent protease
MRAVFIVALSLLVAGCDSPEERAEKHYQRGLELIRAEETDRARIEFQNARRLVPDHEGALLELAQLFESRGETRQAANLYGRIADIQPDNLEVLKRLSRLLLDAGAVEGARSRLDEAYALAPDDSDIQGMRAALLYATGQQAEGLDYANRAVRSDPDNLDANLVLIASMIADENESAALTRIDELLVVSPENRALHTIKLQLLFRTGDQRGGEEQLRQMIATFPDVIEFREALARFYLGTDNAAGAEEQFRAIADMREDDSEAILDLLRFLNARYGADATRQEIEARLASDVSAETRLQLNLALADLELRAGNVDGARDVLQRVVETAAPTEADEARIQLARLDIAEGDNEAARTRVDTVLERDGDNVKALALRGEMEIDADRPDAAILTLRRALSLDPQNIEVLLLEARAQQRNGNATLAGERLGAATRAAEFRPDVALRYASFLRDFENQPASAESVLVEAVRRHPGDVRLLAMLADIRLRQDDFTGAEDVARQLRTLEGGNSVADRIVAESLSRQGRAAESLGVLKQIVEESDGEFSAFARLVSAHLAAGDTAAARELIDGRLQEDPEDVRALIVGAEFDWLEGNVEAAGEGLRRVVDIAPEQEIGHAALTRYLLATGQIDEAVATAEAGIEVATSNNVLRLIVGSLHEQRGDIDRAIEQYAALYDQQPDSLVAANNYASLLAEYREDDAEAMERASRIARRLRNSTVPHFLDTYGWIAFLNGDTASAIPALEAASANLPNNALVRYHYGRALVATGSTEQGRLQLEAALAIDPAFPKAQSARQVLESDTGVGQ